MLVLVLQLPLMVSSLFVVLIQPDRTYKHHGRYMKQPTMVTTTPTAPKYINTNINNDIIRIATINNYNTINHATSNRIGNRKHINTTTRIVKHRMNMYITNTHMTEIDRSVIIHTHESYHDRNNHTCTQRQPHHIRP